MTNSDYLKDISEIKNLMKKSTRFLSLSGLSGIIAGVLALIGAYFAYNIIHGLRIDGHIANTLPINIIEYILLGIAFGVTLLSVMFAFILTKRKAKRNGEKIWDASSKRLLFHFLIPLITGGIFVLLLLNKGYYGLIAPTTLIFYGLALIHASNYTIGNVKYLGLAEVILGLICMCYLGYGIIFWAIGFGVFHIVYGTIMHFKLDKSQS